MRRKKETYDKVLLWNLGSIRRRDESVGVGRVTNNDNACFFALRGLVESLTLHGEDVSVLRQKITTFHSFGSGHRANKKSVVNTLKSLLGIVSDHDSLQGRVGTVIELHDDSFERIHGARKLEEVENDGHVGAEDLATRNAEKHGVADVTSSTSDSDTNGLTLGGNDTIRHA